jgi:hypothetical protein
LFSCPAAQQALEDLALDDADQWPGQKAQPAAKAVKGSKKKKKGKGNKAKVEASLPATEEVCYALVPLLSFASYSSTRCRRMGEAATPLPRSQCCITVNGHVQNCARLWFDVINDLARILE